MLHFKKNTMMLLIVAVFMCISCIACSTAKSNDDVNSDMSYEEWKETWTDQFLFVQLECDSTWVDSHENDYSIEQNFYHHWEMKEPVVTRSMFYNDWFSSQTETTMIECLDKDEFSYTFLHQRNADIWAKDDATKDYSITFNFKRDDKGIFSVEVVFSEAMEDYKDQLIMYELLNAEEADAKAQKYGISNFLNPQPVEE